MPFGNHLFKIKLKLTDLKLKAKSCPASFLKAVRSLNRLKVKSFLYGLIFGIKPLILNTSADLRQWDFKTKAGVLRFVLLFSFLSFFFYIAGSRYAFLANDGFISFRYVSNAVNGWGYTFNPPPFEPVDGYTSFLWLIVLRGLWATGIRPPYSANLATFVFSMGQIWLSFLFIRRMNIQPRMQAKSLYLFLVFCLILITNRTFLAFMTSGTEAALFNFLVLLWVYAVTSNKTKPFFLVFCSLLLSLCRLEGFIFVAASVCFLILFAFQKRSPVKSLLAIPFSGIAGLYYIWLNETYGDYLPLSFSAFFKEPFPDFGRDYILSFVLEYSLYFWVIFLFVWAGFKFIVRRQDGFIPLFLLMLTFMAYVGFYLFIMGGDILEYRPLSFFIPLCTLAGIKMLAENIVGRPSTVVIILLVYILISTAIPMTHRSITQNLETRRETAFLYRPVSGKTGWLGFFTKQWDESQKKLIYQGIGLRHQEHKILTEELKKTFPERQDGQRIPQASNYLFAWDFVGVPAWTLPQAVIIDLSGQNNKIVAQTDFKFPKRRLFGHERNVPDGYIRCFGGNTIYISPFIGKKNMSLSKNVFLSNGKIKGCEDFWKTQTRKGAPKAKSLRDPFR